MSRFFSRLLGLRKNSAKVSPAKRSRPLWIEALENRTVPTTVKIAVIGDFGVSANSNATGATGSGVDVPPGQIQLKEKAVADLVNGWDSDNWAVSPTNTGNKVDALITAGDNTYTNASKTYLDYNIGQYYSNFIYPYKDEGGWDYQEAYPDATMYGSATNPNPNTLPYYTRSGSTTNTNRMFLTLGNHDWGSNSTVPQTYMTYFNLPGEDGSQQGQGRYYTFTVGSVQFFCLDSSPTSNPSPNGDTNSTGLYTGTEGGYDPDGASSSSVQAQWLKAQLAASTAPWKVIYFHHAAWTTGGNGNQAIMRWPFQSWGDPGLQAGQTPSTIVVAGHMHAYERLTAPDIVTTEPGYTGQPLTYITEGVGGAGFTSYSGTAPSPSVSVYREAPGFNVTAQRFGAGLITATETTFSYEHFTIDAPTTATDSLTLSKTTPVPIVSIAATANANETGLVPGTFTITRTGATTNSLTVNLLRGGTATNGTDYQSLGGSATIQVTIPASSASTTVTVTPIADTTVEGTETVMLTVIPGSAAYNTAGSSIATVSIADEDVALIAAGSSIGDATPLVNVPWKYLDNGSNQGSAWRADGFVDSSWSTGTSRLGYDVLPNGTDVGTQQTTVGYGGDVNSKFVTTYFRKTITVTNAQQILGLKLRLQRDDGVVVYITNSANPSGTEVFRSNMPTGAISSTTTASTSLLDGSELTWLETTLSPSLLVTGTNTICVEIHQGPKFNAIGTSIFTGTWESDDVIRAIVGSDTVDFTAGSTSTATVVSNLVSAWNGLSAGTHPGFRTMTASSVTIAGQPSLQLTSPGTAFTVTLQPFDVGVTAPDSQLIAGINTVSAISVGLVSSSDIRFNLELLASVDAAPPAQPEAPHLVSDEEGITNDNTPVFEGSAEPFSTVNLYLNGGTTAVGTGPADSNGNYSITTSVLPDSTVGGPDHIMRATATDVAGNVSPLSSGYTFLVDTIAPTLQIIAVSPDPRSAAVDEIHIHFSEAVFNFPGVGDYELRRNGNLVAGGTLTSDQAPFFEINYTLSNLSSLTSALGHYVLTVGLSGHQILDQAANLLVTSAVETWDVVANSPPTLNQPVDVTVNEDSGSHVVNLGNITPGPTADSLQTVSVSAFSSNTALIHNPGTSYTNPNTTGTLTFTPEDDQFGSTTITVVVNDGQSSSNTFTRTFVVTVSPVNDAPTLDQPVDLTISEDAAPFTVDLAGITAGPTNESTQTLSLSVSSSDNFKLLPKINSFTPSSGTASLLLTPGANANGDVTITLTVNDSQGSSNKLARTFAVHISAANDPPTLDPINPITVNEDALATTINLTGITVGPSDETGTLSVSASSSNTNLVAAVNLSVNYSDPSNSGTLTFTPTAQANGSTTISVVVNDGGSGNHTITRTFVVTVSAVNDPPTLDTPVAMTVNEDAPPQTVNLSGIAAGPPNESGQTLTLTTSSSDTSLIPRPTISYSQGNTTAALTFTPNKDVFGTATITVTVNDQQNANNKVSRTFVVTIAQVNRPPTLSAINPVTVNEDSGNTTLSLLGIGPGAASEGSQTVSVSASTEQTDLITNLGTSYSGSGSTGSLTFRPVDNASGTATITVTVNDGQGDHNTFTRSFVVTVNAVNDAPTLTTLSAATINEDAATQTVGLSGITAGPGDESNQVLSVTATSSNLAVIKPPTITSFSPSSGTAQLHFTPVPNGNGTAVITVTVNDGQPANNTFSRSFTVTVTPDNDPPTLNFLPDLYLPPSAGLQTVNLSGITSGATNETQNLTVTATSSNTALIADPSVSYTTPSSTGSLSFTPAAGSGTTTITVTVVDGLGSNNTIIRSFVVTIA